MHHFYCTSVPLEALLRQLLAAQDAFFPRLLPDLLPLSGETDSYDPKLHLRLQLLGLRPLLVAWQFCWGANKPKNVRNDESLFSKGVCDRLVERKTKDNGKSLFHYVLCTRSRRGKRPRKKESAIGVSTQNHYTFIIPAANSWYGTNITSQFR